MYRVAHAGQMGYHTRIEYNKKIMLISDKPEQVNPNGGLIRYGTVRTTFILLKGSLPGPTKRMIRLETPIRPNKKQEDATFTLQEISLESKQGN
jgi:large subunit ribosomal protein L3